MKRDAICGSRAADVLVYLCANDSARFSTLEDRLEANPSLLSRRLDELADAGWIERVDGVYRITPRGRSMAGLLGEREDDVACDRFCEPSICLPDVTDVDGALSERSRSWLHRTLAAAPVTRDELTEHLETDADGATVEDRLRMAVRWNYVREDESVYVRTRKGSRALAALDAVAGMPDSATY